MTEPKTQESWWAAWHRGGRLEVLDPIECWGLLSGMSIGRLGFHTEKGPRIIPVNYNLAGESIVIRTAPGTEIARLAPGQTVAFEIDQIDNILQTGWSILAVGVLNVVPLESLRVLAPHQTPDPWVEGPRSVFLEFDPHELTGRRIHQA